MKTKLLLALLLAGTTLLAGCRFYIDAAPRIIITSDELPVPIDALQAP